MKPILTTLDQRGRTTVCWALSWRERMTVMLTGRLWHQVSTLRQPLQPQWLGVTKPLLEPPRDVRDATESSISPARGVSPYGVQADQPTSKAETARATKPPLGMRVKAGVREDCGLMGCELCYETIPGFVFRRKDDVTR